MSYFPWNTKELLSAYAAGLFPTKAKADGPFFLHEPQRRALLPISGMHVSRTLAQKLRKGEFKITFDSAFLEVIKSCVRNTDNWITPDLSRIYTRAHAEGWCHSVECWQNDSLAGGLYGLAIGAVFYVESMFSIADDASKIATFYLLEECRKQGFQIIDLQFMSPHLESLGGYEIDRTSFRSQIESAIHVHTTWGQSFRDLDKFVGVPRAINTDRLTIRRFRPQDASSLFEWHQSETVHRFTLVEPLSTLAAASDYVDKAIRNNYSQGILDPLAICLKTEEHQVIGTIGCFRPQIGLPTLELAFDLDPRFWGQGIVVEAGKALIDLTFESFPVERIQSRCVKENTSSHRVLEKLGMTFEGTLRSAMYHRDRFWDMNYFSLIRQDACRQKR